MWTKGMLMTISGIAGLLLTFLWILILIVRSARNKRRLLIGRERALEEGPTTIPVQTEQAFQVESTVLMEQVDDTVQLDNNVKDTEIL